MAPVAARLQELLAIPVVLASDTAGPGAQPPSPGRRRGRSCCWRTSASTRREPRRTPLFGAPSRTGWWSSSGDGGAYVGDGFGAVHRAHASVVDLPDRLPHAAGGLVSPSSRCSPPDAVPGAAVRGGPRWVEGVGQARCDRQPVTLLTTADRLVVGGGMVFTFLAALGHGVGRSLLEADQLDAVARLSGPSRDAGIEVVLPADMVVATGSRPTPTPAVVAPRRSGDQTRAGHRPGGGWPSPRR